MKNIRLYETEVNYTSEKDNHEYPTVSYCKENDMVYYYEKVPLFEFVDLGLPSGTLWADRNVGASKPEEFGLYFAWGETQGYKSEDVDNGVRSFNWKSYKWSADAGGSTMTKYNEIDGLTTLEVADDAATTVDSSCRMPTKEEYEELVANTTSAVTIVNEVSGVTLTSKVNDNSIFIPFAGYVDGSYSYTDDQNFVYMWSSSLYNEYVYDDYGKVALCYINYEESIDITNFFRKYGMVIRPVKK